MGNWGPGKSHILGGRLPLVEEKSRYGRPRLWQSPPPASGSWREEADDAGVFHEVGGPASPGAIGWNSSVRVGSRISPEFTQERSSGPKPSQSTQILQPYRPGVWNLAVHAHDMPPRRRPGWAGESVARLPPPTPLSDHQRVSAEIHGTWERCGN